MPQELSNHLAPTNEDTAGPYFPIYFEDKFLEDLTCHGAGVIANAAGQQIILRGSVYDRFGNLTTGVIMEFWQANAKGVYHTPKTVGHVDIDPWFNGYGRLRAHTGEYEFRTILPGASQNRAPHITITLFCDGISRIVTQMFFADQKSNAADPLLASLDEGDRSRLLATYDGRTDDNIDIYSFDIIMAGDNETPFFDDMEQ